MTFIAYVFPKIQTANNAVRQMSKKPRFWTLFGSQHVKGSQTLVISAWQHFYQISSSLWAKLTRKISLLMICEINTLTANAKYSLPTSENLLQPIQIQLSKKRIIFFEFVLPILKSISTLENFEKKRWHS